ncbi:SDR family oxidoreductase [Gordonia sp. NPDC003424]
MLLALLGRRGVDLSSLQGKVALVTGAASGIGRETALALAGHGVRLILLDIDGDGLTEVAGQIGDDQALVRVVSVTDVDALKGAVAEGISRFGGIDLVLANAGIHSYGTVLTVDPDAFRRVIEVNLIGVFNTVHVALPSVIDRQGYILIVSSAAAYAALGGMAPYAASKAGVEQFANVLRGEVGFRGVDVGSAHMLWIDTPMVREAKADLPTFQQMINAAPGPFRGEVTVEKCAAAFVRALATRQRRVNVPEWVGLLRWLKPVLSSRVMDKQNNAMSAELADKTDAEVAQLNRSVGARMARLDTEL